MPLQTSSVPGGLRCLGNAMTPPRIEPVPQASGPLSFLIHQKGSIDSFKRKLAEAGLSDITVQETAEPPHPFTFEVC